MTNSEIQNVADTVLAKYLKKGNSHKILLDIMQAENIKFREINSAADKLRDAEAKLIAIESANRGTLPWFDVTATARQSVSIRNSTGSAFSNSPVLVRLADIPAGTAQKTLKFYGMDGIAIPYEVESWNPGGTSAVWVKIPFLPAKGNTNIYAYYGGDTANNDSTKVWDDNYKLVEHFATDWSNGSTHTDSTGKQTGTVSGDGLKTALLTNGTLGEHFSNTKISYGDIGGGLDQVSVSAIYQVTDEDLSKTPSGDVPFFAKKLAESSKNDSLFLGLNNTAKTLRATHIGSWFEANPNGMNKNDISSALPQDGNPHLVTLTYDGMTVAVYVDGQRIYQTFKEYSTTPKGEYTPATIGAYSNIGQIKTPFCGTLDEIQLSGYRVTPEWESFRYSNYFGDAVTCGELQKKTDTCITLHIAMPISGSTNDAGMINVTGVVSKACSFTADVASESFACGTSDAGSFSILVPVNKIGNQIVKLTAVSKDNANDKATDTVSLVITDSKGPKQPVVSDSSVNGIVTGNSATLTAKNVTNDREKVTASFYSNASIPLTAANTVVKTGTSTSSLTDDIKPTIGSSSAELFPTTQSSDSNPYQIYTITLNDNQVKAPRFHMVWNGTAEREVTAYVYNTATSAWVKIGSAYDPNAESVSINLDIANENVLDGNKLTLLLWRGMNEKIDGRSSYVPTAGQFDFSFSGVPDSQLYAQSYPEYGTGQYQWIVDNAQAMKTKMVVHLGDLVNRPWLNQEYQWPCMDKGYNLLEAANIPYVIAWGNHDYETGTNNRVMYNKYFPVSRIQKAAGSLWGGAFSVDKNSPSDNTYCLLEQNGAKIMVMTIGYWMSDADLNWAAYVINQHPDYSVIVATHYYISGNGDVGNSNFYNKIVKPYKNVKLVLCGHVGNTGYRYDKFSDHETYGILFDYQGLPFGGEGFLRNIKFDVENDLLYFNTYSSQPIYSDKTQSPYGGGTYTNVNGGKLYQLNRDEFAIGLDLGGSTVRTLKTNSITMASSKVTQIATNQTITGNGTSSVELSDLIVNTPYEWFVVFTDEAGNKTTSETKYFSTVASTAPAVSSVTVKPSMATIKAGSTQAFSAQVNGVNSPSQGINWSVSGNNSNSTTINGSGLLTVASNEKANTLTVTATSAADKTKYGTAKITVLPKDAIITPPNDSDDNDSSSNTDDVSITNPQVFVKNEDIHNGIAEEKVDLTKGSTKVSVDQMSVLMENNKKKPVVFEGKDYTITFAANTMQAVSGQTSFDFSISVNSGSNYEKIKELSGDSMALVIDYNYSGQLPAEATIKIKVGAQYAGKSMHYYYYNDVTGVLEFLESAVVDADGIVTVKQTHCSSYVLLTAKLGENATNSSATQKASSNPHTGVNSLIDNLLYNLAQFRKQVDEYFA